MAEIINLEKKPKKKKSFLLKIIIILLIIFLGFIGFKYLKTKSAELLSAKKEIAKFTNIESEIFDLSADKDSEDSSSTQIDDSKFSDLTLTQLKEGGAEFIYQLLLRNQIQISDLKNDIRDLKSDFSKYRSEQKSEKIIFVYIDLRQRFFAGEDYQESLRGLETIAITDKELQKKIIKLKPLLANFSGTKNLVNDFEALIPEIIATKTNNPNGNFIEKVRHNLAKLIIVRKLDSNAQTVDGAVRRTETFLHEDDFISALDSLATLDSSFHEILASYMGQLKNAAEIQKLDQEIMLYLRGNFN